MLKKSVLQTANFSENLIERLNSGNLVYLNESLYHAFEERMHDVKLQVTRGKAAFTFEKQGGESKI